MNRLLALLLALASSALGAEPKAPPSEGAKAAAELQAKLDALRKEGTGFDLRTRYQALLTEAAAVAERHAADPTAARAFLIIARCCEALGKHPEKEAAFARYVDLLAAASKDQAVAELRAEAEALVARRELFSAVKLLRLMLSKFPDGPEAAYALYRLGTCQLWMDRYDDAAAALSEVIQRWPKDELAAQARLRLARTNVLQNKHADSVPLLEAFLEQNPKSPDRDAALFHLAVARYLAADPYGALLGFQRVLRDAPKSPYAELARAALAKLRSEILRRIEEPEHDHRGD